MEDPDLKLREGGEEGGLDLLVLLAFFPSVITSFFFTQNKGGGGGAEPPGPSPRFATDLCDM